MYLCVCISVCVYVGIGLCICEYVFKHMSVYEYMSVCVGQLRSLDVAPQDIIYLGILRQGFSLA